MARSFLAIVSVMLFLARFSVAAESPLQLHPISGLDRTSDRALVYARSPRGWHSIGIDEQYSASFVLDGPKNSPKRYVFLHVAAYHRGHTDLWDGSPRHSYIGRKVSQDGDITECRSVASFDAEPNGRLHVWRFRSSGDDYYCVFFRRKDTVVEADLRSHDADELTRYVAALEEAVRSVRVVQ